MSRPFTVAGVRCARCGVVHLEDVDARIDPHCFLQFLESAVVTGMHERIPWFPRVNVPWPCTLVWICPGCKSPMSACLWVENGVATRLAPLVDAIAWKPPKARDPRKAWRKQRLPGKATANFDGLVPRVGWILSSHIERRGPYGRELPDGEWVRLEPM